MVYIYIYIYIVCRIPLTPLLNILVYYTDIYMIIRIVTYSIIQVINNYLLLIIQL